jgi:hypothetical protein
MNDYTPLLISLGLSSKESSLYLALLELGTADVADIARKAGVKRSTAYLLLDGIHEALLRYRKERGDSTKPKIRKNSWRKKKPRYRNLRKPSPDSSDLQVGVSTNLAPAFSQA